jgi:hypothetical protein
MDPSPGDSREQREAEAVIIDGVAGMVGATLKKRRLSLSDGSWVEVDGYSGSPAVVCEAWAHIGPPKSAQKNKVMTDALKLFVCRLSHFKDAECRAILAFCDENAARHFTGLTWMAEALRSLEIEVMVVPVPGDLRSAVLKAQERQFR